MRQKFLHIVINNHFLHRCLGECCHDGSTFGQIWTASSAVDINARLCGSKHMQYLVKWYICLHSHSIGSWPCLERK